MCSNLSGNINWDQQIKAHINGSLFDLEIIHQQSTILDNLKDKNFFIFGLNWTMIQKYDFDVSKYQRVIDITTKGFSKCLTELEIFPYANIVFNPINVMYNFEENGIKRLDFFEKVLENLLKRFAFNASDSLAIYSSLLHTKELQY